MSINLGSLKLKHPVMVGAGPWSRNAESIQRCIDNGASAVVTETMTLDAYPTLSPHLYMEESHRFNTKLFSDLQLEQWEREFEKIDKKDSKLIASIWGSSCSEVFYLASKVEKMGADAIELSLVSPIGTRNQMIVNQAKSISEFIKSALNAVKVPVIVKLSYETGNDPAVTKMINESGIKVVSAIDGMKGLIDIDIETQSARMPTYGGFTGNPIRPMSLATTAALKQNTSLQICSVGGISNYEHVLEYIMLGAEAVQLASTIQLKGYDVISEIISKLDEWLSDHNYDNISEIRGSALSSLMPFEDIDSRSLAAHIDDPCDEKCTICFDACLYGGISKDKEGISINNDSCTGCGLCVDICPGKKIRMKWL